MQRVTELQELDETKFLAYFQQPIEKARKLFWHDMNIKTKTFVRGDKVLLYEIRYQKHLGNLRIIGWDHL
jgi:hypothetical protein